MAAEEASAPAEVPERLLLVALLEEAVRTYQTGARYDDRADKQTLRLEAAAWFQGAAGGFTFADVCDHLGIDPTWFRRKLGAGDGLRVVKSLRVGRNGNLRVCSKALVGLNGPRPTTAWGPRAGARLAVQR